MKLQFFSLTPSVPGVNMLRLKDGVYSRVPLLPGASGKSAPQGALRRCRNAGFAGVGASTG